MAAPEHLGRACTIAEVPLLRLIILDPSSLFAAGTGPRPYAKDAIDTLGMLTSADGRPLEFLVIAVSRQDADTFSGLLDLSPDRFLVPEPGADDMSEDRGGVTGLKTRYGVQNPVEECLVVTGKPGQPAALDHLDIPAIILGGTGIDACEDWRAALLKIAQRTGGQRAGNLSTVLSGLATWEGIDNPNPHLQGPDEAEVTGQSWVPLDDEDLGPLSGLYVQMPTALTVLHLESAEPHISKTVTADDMEEAKAFVRSLKAHGQLEAPGTPDLEKAPSLLGRPTHYVETDKAGRRLLKRRGFD